MHDSVGLVLSSVLILVLSSVLMLPSINVLASHIILSIDVALTVCYTVLTDTRCSKVVCH